jgi:hypothetical protein
MFLLTLLPGRSETISVGGRTLHPQSGSGGAGAGGFAVLLVGVCDNQLGGIGGVWRMLLVTS